VGLTSLCSSCGHHRRMWMDPHVVQVDLEPPLAAVRSGPAMTAGARRGTVRVEEPPLGTDLCRWAGRAPLRSCSTATRQPIGGRVWRRRGPRWRHHLPRFAHRRWSLTGPILFSGHGAILFPGRFPVMNNRVLFFSFMFRNCLKFELILWLNLNQ
jgi:hypothetical protein